VVLRLLILKHVRNWSYCVLNANVRANLVYRDFHPRRRREDARCQDNGPLGLGSRAAGHQTIHQRIVQIAQAKEVDAKAAECGWTHGGRRPIFTIRPTPSLLGDGVRVLIRTMKKITKIAGEGWEPKCETAAAA